MNIHHPFMQEAIKESLKGLSTQGIPIGSQVTVRAFWGHFDRRNRPKKFLKEHSDMFLMPLQLKGRLQSN